MVSIPVGLFALMIIWGFVNPIITKLTTGKYPEVMYSPESGPFNCCSSIFFLFIIIIPISSLAETLLIEHLSWKAWIPIPVVAVCCAISTFFVCSPLFIMFAPINWGAVAIAALDNALWGGSYWIIFSLAGFILRILSKEPAEVENTEK